MDTLENNDIEKAEGLLRKTALSVCMDKEYQKKIRRIVKKKSSEKDSEYVAKALIEDPFEDYVESVIVSFCF
jgi:hypothetical protein